MHERPRRLLLVAALSLAVFACSRPEDSADLVTPVSVPVGGATGQELAAEQVLRRGNGTEPESLDPHRSEGVPASTILRDLYEGLLSADAAGRLIPGAAERWTISQDGKVYTFTLRRDGRWSNGEPVTAADFEFALKRSADPATLSEYSAILAPIENAEAVVAGQLPPAKLGVRALNDRTLEIRLRAPTPYLLGLLTHSSTYAVHRPSVAKYGSEFARPGRMITNGAYTMAEWVVQSHVKAVRNKFYWNDRNTVIDEVWYFPVENADSELNRYRAGEIDMTETVPARRVQWLKKNLPRELHIAPYLGSYVFGFNTQQPPFQNNRNLRLALSMAIDRDVLTEKISTAGEIPSYAWVPPIPGYESPVPEWAGWSQQQREDEARRLYAAAGYSRENPLRTELMYNTEINHKRICAAMQAMWREVLGAEITLVNKEWQIFLQDRRARIETRAFRYGWIGDYEDPFTFAEILHSQHGLNDMGYNNPRYDELLSLAGNEADPKRRFAYLRDAERIMLDDMPIIPVYYYVSKQLVRPWVAGFESNILDHHRSQQLRILKH